MKIGILTYHWVANMGANLQALSTYKYLENHGFEPIIINWIPEDVELYYIKNVCESQRLMHSRFMENHFSSITKLCRDSKDVAACIVENGVHLVCIGSDAVFSTRPKISRWHFGRRGLRYIKPYSDATIYNPYWGNFIDILPPEYTIELVALSASAQNSPYRKIIFSNEKKEYCNALNRFSRITVRDVWTQNLCKYVSKGKICPQITPDPVFAFNFNVNPEPLHYVQNKLGVSDRYALISVSSSVHDTDWLKKIESLFAQKGITLIGLPKTNAPFENILQHNIEFPLDPLEWYDAIKFSLAYIGELMHPVLVALHNAVPVYVFDTYGFKHNFKFDYTSSKTFQILKRFNLECNYYNPLYNTLPSPDKVFESIITTNSCSIKNRAQQLLSEYQNMMNFLLPNT